MVGSDGGMRAESHLEAESAVYFEVEDFSVLTFDFELNGCGRFAVDLSRAFGFDDEFDVVDYDFARDVRDHIVGVIFFGQRSLRDVVFARCH